MLMQLTNEDVLIQAGSAQYLIHADWSGVHDIVSECGWWIGKVRIVHQNGLRYIDWLYAYSIKFDD